MRLLILIFSPELANPESLNRLGSAENDILIGNASATQPGNQFVSQEAKSYEQLVFDLTNEERIKAGLTPLHII